MTDQALLGKLVYLTAFADFYLRERNPGFAGINIVLANRLARVSKVFDWESAEGQLLLKERAKSDKWKNLDPKEYKFVLSIYYPDLKRDERDGLVVDEVMPMNHPVSKNPLFRVLPDWMHTEIAKKVSTERTFSLVPETPNSERRKSTKPVKKQEKAARRVSR